MAHTKKHLLENHQFGIMCTSPFDSNIFINLQYNSHEECDMVYKKMKNESSTTRRKIMLLLEMAKTPYALQFNKEFVMSLRELWDGEN